MYYLLGVRQLTWKVQQPSISNVMKKWGGQTTALCSPYRNLGKKCRNTAAILREQLRQKMQKNYGKKSQNMCENCTYVVAIYKKIVFRDFCVRNTGRYKEVVGTAIFWHKIKARCFVLCVLGEFSAQNTLVLHNCIFFACQLPKNNDKSSRLSAEFAEICAPQQKIAETYKKSWQFAGHGQNCELAAKGKNCGKIAACKITIFCKD